MAGGGNSERSSSGCGWFERAISELASALTRPEATTTSVDDVADSIVISAAAAITPSVASSDAAVRCSVDETGCATSAARATGSSDTEVGESDKFSNFLPPPSPSLLTLAVLTKSTSISSMISADANPASETPSNIGETLDASKSETPADSTACPPLAPAPPTPAGLESDALRIGRDGGTAAAAGGEGAEECPAALRRLSTLDAVRKREGFFAAAAGAISVKNLKVSTLRRSRPSAGPTIERVGASVRCAVLAGKHVDYAG